MVKRAGKNKSLHPYPSKSPLKTQDPRIFEDMPFKWRAISKYVDYDEKEWGWGEVKMRQFFSNCLNWLKHYEDKTWAQMKEGGHCHPAHLKDIAVRAQNRIIETHPDMGDLYQVKAEGKCRLFGHKDRQIFFLIWHDAKHTVYPMGK